MSTLAERFEAKVDRSPGQGPNGDCHEWTASTRNGYGQIQLGGGTIEYAHRFAWFLETGEWPLRETPFVLHHCDNRLCVRIEHLFLGTNADNIADKVAKGRQARGERAGGAKLTEADVRTIRAGEGPQREVASRFGICQQTVSEIRLGEKWKHVS